MTGIMSAGERQPLSEEAHGLRPLLQPQAAPELQPQPLESLIPDAPESAEAEMLYAEGGPRVEADPPTPKEIVLISFARNERAFVLEERGDKSLQGRFVNRGLTDEQAKAWNDRALDLSDCDEIIVGQIDVDETVRPKIHVSTTLHAESRRVRMHISYRDVTKPYAGDGLDGKEVLDVDEKEILEVFTGEDPGIVILEAEKGLPEENALVIKVQEPEKRVAYVFFLHDGGKHRGMDSTEQLEFFLKRLNEEFDTHASSKLQKEAVAALRRGRFTITGVRREWFEAAVNAHSINVARDPSNHKSTEFLEKHLRALRGDFLTAVAKLLGMQFEIDAAEANRYLNRLFLRAGVRIPTVPKANVVKTPEPAPAGSIYDRLQTESARTFRRSLEVFSSINELTQHPEIRNDYISRLIDTSMEVETDQELLDAAELWKELARSPVGTQHTTLRLMLNGQTGHRIAYLRGEYIQLGTLAKTMQDEIVKRRYELRKIVVPESPADSTDQESIFNRLTTDTMLRRRLQNNVKVMSGAQIAMYVGELISVLDNTSDPDVFADVERLSKELADSTDNPMVISLQSRLAIERQKRAIRRRRRKSRDD
jgi:hypothetical protein